MKKYLLFLIFTCVLFSAKGQMYPPLIFNFDSIEPIYFGSPNNIWQIGQPQKTFFNSAYTFPNAIVTDTINTYPINNTSVFIVKTPTYMGPMGGVVMQFHHKFDTDTLQDGGTIEVSLDSINWTNLLSSPNLLWGPFGYYAPQDSVIGFSGKSNGWQYTSCFWNYPPSQYLFVKFKFTSDNIQNNKEGWMIDTLRFEYNLGIGINEMKNNFLFSVSPNPSSGIFSITSSEKIQAIEIMDMLGRQVCNWQICFGKEKEEIDLTKEQKGIYFVKVIDEEGNYSVKKIIIE